MYREAPLACVVCGALADAEPADTRSAAEHRCAACTLADQFAAQRDDRPRTMPPSGAIARAFSRLVDDLVKAFQERTLGD
jgi:hypothetical protein